MIESVNAALTAKFGEGKYVTASFTPIAMQPTTHGGFSCAKNCDRANRLLRWLRLLLFRILVALGLIAQPKLAWNRVLHGRRLQGHPINWVGSQKRQAAGGKIQAADPARRRGKKSSKFFSSTSGRN
jgi:hypothetical protein